MTAEKQCPHCGKPVPPTALQGICPECMLKAGLAADTGEAGPGGVAVAKPVRPAPPVEEIAPHFPQLEILECLGRGGMGAVYKARQPKLDRFVALKILTRHREGGITDTEFTARFQQEARALARITHPDIVAIYDFGEAGGHHYLLMEYVDGLTLRQLLQTQKLTPEQALSIVPKICEALQFAHERGIVHRDIKPENILLDKQGRVKIADFGIAKIVGTEAAGHGLTGAKDVMGTPHYMAPEQIEKPTTVDHRADIYSLGVVFYEMLTGELPLGKFQSPSRMVQVDVRLDEVVLHALEKNPDRRYQHVSEVKTAVETIAASPESGSSRRKEAQTEMAEVREQMVAAVQYNPWELAITVGGTILLLSLLFLAAPKLPPPFNVFLIVMCVIGLVICAITFAGFWPFPSPLFPEPNFASRNLSRPKTTGSPQGNQSAPSINQSRVMSAATMRWVTAVRWTARVVGTLFLLLFGVMIIGEGMPAIGSQPTGVQLGFAALGLTFAGILLGWKREGVGALLVGLGWTTWHVVEGRFGLNLFQVPLLVALLYGYCWWATRGRRTGVVLGTLAVLAVLLGLGRLFVPTSVFVRGTIIDAQTHQTIPNAEMRLLPRTRHALAKGDWPEARADKNGRFDLYLGWYAEARQLAISATNYATLTTNLGRRALGQRNVSRDFYLQRTESPTAFDATRAVALFNEIEDFGHEFDAAFTSRNLAAVRTGTGRLLNLLSNFNEVVRGMDLGFPPAILDDVAKIRRALDEGDWEKAQQLGQRNEEYARAFKRIGDRMVQLARQNQNALAALSPAPPVVVATVPPSGAANVDPSLTEIRVTFSKDMITDRMWSFVQVSEETFPKSDGQVHYLEDKRTCVLPVRLQPGKVYAIWINSEKYHAFQDQERQPAVPYLLIFETRKSK